MTSFVTARLADSPDAAVFRKTITESDINLFAGITGDLNSVHIDDIYVAELSLPGRIAHGVFTLGLMSTACTLWSQRHSQRILSYGWEKIRFIHPVYVGDTVTAAYRVDDAPGLRSGAGWRRTAAAEARNQNDEVVAVGQHILYLFDPPENRLAARHEEVIR